ncbi:MAG: Hsp20/alpha crystallin family protein [Elusimicrobia bacterium]|nr:Hsp20/alpha crystallin family protein [Elusimicrobiota bacterium]
MAPHKTRVPSPEGSAWKPVRDVLETLEQVAATGWYPARRELLSRLGSVPRPDLPVWVPEADVEETPREFVVTFALPGVEKDEIHLSVTEDEVAIRGRRGPAKDERAVIRRELAHGEFLRRLPLPAEVKPATARATHRNGLLRVTVERARAAVGRSVKIE